MKVLASVTVQSGGLLVTSYYASTNCTSTISFGIKDVECLLKELNAAPLSPEDRPTPSQILLVVSCASSNAAVRPTQSLLPRRMVERSCCISRPSKARQLE